MEVLGSELIDSRLAKVIESISRNILDRAILGLNFLLSVTARVFPLLKHISEGVGFDRATDFDVVIQLIIEIHRQSNGFIPIWRLGRDKLVTSTIGDFEANVILGFLAFTQK